MLQERVGSELHHDAISAQFEGRVRTQRRLLTGSRERWQPRPPDLEFGWGRVGQKEGCSFQRLLSRQNSEQGES